MRPLSSNSYQALATYEWFGMVTMRIQRPSTRSALTTLKDYEPPLTCITLAISVGLYIVVPVISATGLRAWGYAQATAKRMFNVERLEWLRDAQLRKLVAALQIDANRRVKGD